ncbi:uncharacterized protein [Diadema setosum]|uniref:uncharacterized protein n=1 Tax=Diadema setosum TaxID=31175 RepID=UPI003B3B21F7
MTVLMLSSNNVTSFHDASDDGHEHEEDASGFLAYDLIAITLIILSDALIILCNIFLLLVLRRRYNYDIGDVEVFLYRIMASTDIVAGIASTSFQFYSEPNFFNENNTPSAELCLTLLFFCFYFANLSAWLQCLITMNRVILISRPLHYIQIVSVKRAAILLLVSTIISLNCATYLPLPSFPYTNTGLSFCRDGIFDQPSLSLDLGILIACIACPAVLTSALNVHLLIIARRHIRTVSAMDSTSTSATGEIGQQAAPVLRGRPHTSKRGITTVILLFITSYFYVIFSALYVATHPFLSTYLSHVIVSNLLYLLSLSSFWWKLFVLILTDSLFRKTAKNAWVDLKRSLCSFN